ncbi:MAG: hypothetical protein LBI36_04825 [Oscillospiraceae bacterium]|jgi:hypothetical protein|nr:hypothetical protein [Oscillospiraceae bacterium]
MRVLSQNEIDNLLAGLLQDSSILPSPPAPETGNKPNEPKPPENAQPPG